MVLLFRHLGCHFLKPGEFANISISNILQFVESEGLLKVYATDSTKNKKTAEVEGLLPCPPNVFFSTLLYSTLLGSAVLCCTVL